MTATATSLCLHCQLSSDGPFCCRGCEEVHRLLEESGLARYYELGGGEGHPIVVGARDRKWLEPILARVAGSTTLTRVSLDVQGLHCSACVWLLEEVFRRHGGAGVIVNPSVGRIELTIARDFPLARYVDEIESFGYRFGPPLKGDARSELTWRLGVCVAIAMNTMIFGLAIYCGLASGPIFKLFHALDFGLATISVLVGGSIFFRSAWRSLRRGLLHLDVPIALGILLAFGSSAYTYALRGGSSSYFDTLDVFIALMLVGRYLQERVVARNRAYLLASDGAEGLLTRRLDAGAPTLVRCTEVRAGDELLAGHLDLVPVDAELLGAHALFSLDWINGEAAPRDFAQGETIPAGAFHQGTTAVRLRAKTDFDSSTVVSLLRASSSRAADTARSTQWWRRLTGIYVVTVLVVAGASFAGWWFVTRDLARALDVVAAVLIVTCPCAFGIATPLAYELAQAGLRRVGLFVRTPGFLDRAAEVERVVFDKTGTLTTGTLVVTNVEAIEALREPERQILFELAARSSHPKSRAVAAAMRGRTIDPALPVHEVAGRGLELVGDHIYRLGAPGFSRDGEVLCALHTAEETRPDAPAEIRALEEEGYEPHVLSGDTDEATVAVAAACGISAERACGARSPEGKAEWIEDMRAKKTLFVGDGLNDSLAAEAAYCAGTPAIDRPFMAARSDFYVVSPGLAPIRRALHVAKRLARVVRTNLVIAVLYNVVAVALAVAGLMTPLLCAVLMPLSSISTVLATTASLRWTSSSSKSS